ncbi:DNA repair protein RadC [Candidatus Falkowbacteria bacterium]|nr:DNA repair protein RadC [Candidatus Falkowbacteria bacterium]
MVKILDLPKHERPREKLIELGAGNLKDKELLAILLRIGYEKKNAIELAEEVLHKHEMRKFLSYSIDDFLKIKGIDQGKACTLVACFELVKRALEVEDNNLPIIMTARDASAHLQELRTAKKEYFIALYLNARNQLIHKETISIGTLNASLVHPREVFKPAIDHLAASVIVAHNHPSGNLEPSTEDRQMTERLKKAGELLGIGLLDSLIIASEKTVSVKEPLAI